LCFVSKELRCCYNNIIAAKSRRLAIGPQPTPH
jgi:hypothetical protein